MVLDTFRLVNDFTWDRANGIVFDDVIVNQGDANGRKMRVQVVNRGAVENITGAGLNLAWKAPNGKGLDKFTAVNAAQGVFEISFTKGMLANVGRINASLQLILPSGGGIVESRPFVISNQASVVDQDSAQSTDSWTALETTLANAEDLEANYTPKLFSLEQQLQQTNNKIQSEIVNVHEYGAVADYYLADGTVNPNPTDNTQAFQTSINQTGKIKLGESSGYYCEGSLTLPRDPEIYGNYSRIVFAENGLNLGNYTWNRPKIFNLDIFSKTVGANQVRKGKAFYSDNASIVYPKFDNVYIRGFDFGVSSVATTLEPNLAWGSLGKLRIEYCNTPFYLKGGWSNTVHTDELILNFNDGAAIFEDCNQIHRFTIDKLVMETNGNNNDINTSPIHFKNCSNGEFTVKDLYVEHNGKSRKATSQEIVDFTTNGTKINAFVGGSDTQSWVLSNDVYSEDTGNVTSYNLNNNATFKFENCSSDLLVDINGMFIATDLLGLASFVNSPINITISDVFLVTKGYSFPNMREIFTVVGSQPTVELSNMRNSGGGATFNYGGVDLQGDKFSLPFKGRQKELSMTDYLTVPPLETVNMIYDNSLGQDRFVAIDSVDKSKILINESGFYSFTGAFRFGTDSVDGMSVSYYQSAKNQIISYFKNVSRDNVYNAVGMLHLNKGDIVNVRIKTLADSVGSGVAGTTGGTNWLLIRKLI